MKILQVITLSELGGAQSVVINIANSLSLDHEVIVAAGGGKSKMWDLLSPQVIKVPISSLQRSLSLIREVKSMLALRKLYKKYYPDVIHLHSSKIGVLGRIVFPKAKVVYTVHGFDSIRIAYRKYLPLEKCLQKRCQAIVGVSYYDEHNLQNEGITNNVRVIYNGISKPCSLQYDPFEYIKGYKYKVLCIARLSPPKRVDLFLKVAHLCPQYAFIWIGNQHEYTKEYPPNVFFMGSIPNAGSYNEYADLFMLPSDYEGLPMVIIEAMSYGKPVVVSKVGGCNEIVLDEENGYAVGNIPELFASKIKYILENREIYYRFSEKALKYFQDKLTVDRMSDAYLKVYNDICISNGV